MTDPDTDEFYVGYFPVAPPGLGRALRRRALTFLGVAMAAGLGLAATQGPFDVSSFEFGSSTTLEGRVREFPFPVLDVPRPGLTDRRTAYSRYLLVAPGKHGAASLAQGWDGRWVRLSGALIYRQDQTAMELIPGSLTGAEPSKRPEQAPEEVLGEQSLVGEIVDSKCFLGVMNPASRSVHRGCATRCISGGIPPLLVLRDSAGPTRYLLLVGAQGKVINARLIGLIGIPVRVTGTVTREGSQLVMAAGAITPE